MPSPPSPNQGASFTITAPKARCPTAAPPWQLLLLPLVSLSLPSSFFVLHPQARVLTLLFCRTMADEEILDSHCFLTLFNQRLFDKTVSRKKIIPEVGFNLSDGTYPEIEEQIKRRGWRRLASP
ncbi:hypothetical protein PIB30_094882 [Stylosanthes scabra]|uniref:Uncharacterized protein n=1 Tax=Stylosanthes scabra TaxID=79078 RepID=A0ABU6QWM7_9FABA|nr:hypothetical protein [Stylosanthes scabra]